MFVEMKRQADFVGSYLSDNGFLSVTMHGGRFQEQREEALSAFRSNKYRVLVATSVAARGLGKCSLHCISSLNECNTQHTNSILQIFIYVC